MAQAATATGRPNVFQNTKNKLQGFLVIRFFMRVMAEMTDDDGTNMAAGMAYYGFLGLFPLLLGLIALLAIFLPADVVQSSVLEFVQQNLPGAEDVISSNLSSVIELRGTLGIVAILGLLWSGSGIMSAMGHAINRAWDIKREAPLYLKKPRDILYTVVLGVLFFLSLGASAIFTFVPVGTIPFIGSYLVMIALRVMAFLVSFLMILLMFKTIPNTKTYWRHIWPSAFFTAVLFEAGRVGFLYYITTFGNYQAVYGTIGSVIAILIWIYYTALIIIFGAEVSAEYSRMRRGVGQGKPASSIAKT